MYNLAEPGYVAKPKIKNPGLDSEKKLELRTCTFHQGQLLVFRLELLHKGRVLDAQTVLSICLTQTRA